MTKLDPLDQPLDIDDIIPTGVPSEIIHQLREDPLKFLGDYVLDAMKFGQEEKDGFVGLEPVPKTNDSFLLKIFPSGGPNVIASFTLPYVNVSTQLDEPPFVDTLVTPPVIREKTYKYVFTGAFSGCSFVVTQPDPLKQVYRVFHDSRSLSSAFHKRVVMAIDDDQYTESLNYFNTGNILNVWSTMFMQFKDGAWTLYCQPLFLDKVTLRLVKRTPPAPIIRKKDTDRGYKPPPIIQYRSKIHIEMQCKIRELNDEREDKGSPPIDQNRQIRDGPFTKFEKRMPDLDADAVAETRELARILQLHHDDEACPLDTAQKIEINALINRRKGQDQAYLWFLNCRE